MTRNPALDGLRFIAALSIVAIHVSGTRLGYDGSPAAAFINGAASWAVPFFFLVSGYLQQAGERRGFRALLSSRVRRLLIPYAFWTVVLVTLQSVHDPSLLRRLYWPGVVLAGGGFATLWFLPALFYCAVLTYPLRSARQLRAALAVSILAVVVYVGLQINVLILGTLLPVLPLYLLGRLTFEWDGRAPASAAAVLVVSMTLLGIGEALLGWPWNATLVLVLDTVVGGLAALWLLHAAVAGADPLGAGRFAWGGGLMVGIYMLHSLFVMLIDNALPMSWMPAVPWLAVAYAVVAGLAVAGAILLRRVPIIRHVL